MKWKRAFIPVGEYGHDRKKSYEHSTETYISDAECTIGIMEEHIVQLKPEFNTLLRKMKRKPISQ